MEDQSSSPSSTVSNISNHSTSFLSDQFLIFSKWPQNCFDFLFYVFVLLCILLIIATLLGNALVILAVMLVRKLRHPSNFLLVSLAVADFCVGLVVMPLGLIELITRRWILGVMFCRLWTSADLTLCTASIINLCMISVDRYFAVSRPLRYAAERTLKRILVYIAIVWIASLIVSISPLVVFPANDVEGICQINQNAIYQIYATIIAFYGPSCIMVYLYAKMWLAAKRLAKQDVIAKNSVCVKEDARRHRSHRPSALLQRIPLVNRKNHDHDKSEGKARKTLGVMLSVFIICWLPFFIIALLKPYGVGIPYWIDKLALWIGYLNSCMNPIIYCKFNRDFYIPFREMLCCRFCTLKEVMRRESFTNKYGPTRRRTTATDEFQMSSL